MGTLHKSLVRAEAAALSPQCREASGLSADSLARAESLDKVLQQVSVGARVGGGTAGLQGRYYAVGAETGRRLGLERRDPLARTVRQGLV